jgi:uncharacterized protein YigE (DUF2233 family)
VASRPDPGPPLCGDHTVAGLQLTVCEVDLRRDSLRLYWQDDDGRPLATFARLHARVAREGRTLRFATNAGMFDRQHRPVGLYVQNDSTYVPLNLRDSVDDPQPNFYLAPNGVFAVANGRALIAESHAFALLGVAPTLATQSGPLLVSGGRIHPAISPAGRSRKTRSGVGIRADGTVVFAITQDPATFYEFATLFRDALGCPDVLFLDGGLSEVYTGPERLDSRGRFGALFAVTDR